MCFGKNAENRKWFVLSHSSHVFRYRCSKSNFMFEQKYLVKHFLPKRCKISIRLCPFKLRLDLSESCPRLLPWRAVCWSAFSLFSGEEGEDALRKSTMSSSEIAGLMFWITSSLSTQATHFAERNDERPLRNKLPKKAEIDRQRLYWHWYHYFYDIDVDIDIGIDIVSILISISNWYWYLLLSFWMEMRSSVKHAVPLIMLPSRWKLSRITFGGAVHLSFCCPIQEFRKMC